VLSEHLREQEKAASERENNQTQEDEPSTSGVALAVGAHLALGRFKG